MDFQRDDFASIARRKKLAGWLLTLKGPAKKRPDMAMMAALQNTANLYNQGRYDDDLRQFFGHSAA